MDPAQREQLRLAEEILFSGPARDSFVKTLFKGHWLADKVVPYPLQDSSESAEMATYCEKLRKFLHEKLNPDTVDREAIIPEEVIHGLGDIGMLGFTVDKRYGGLGRSQASYCQAMEILAARCGGTAVFVNAHHSIGLRAIELYGSEEQKERWLPALASGRKLAAFALTEPEAGSDAGGVKTRAVYDAEKRVYRINGEKRWITNGGIAGVLTLMAQTEVQTPDGKVDRVTAFLVEPGMPGFKVVEKALEKCGIRGTQTAKLSFENMEVPEANILGKKGEGLKLALTVLDYGRLTFGASCTGIAKELVDRAFAHAAERRQFGRPLREFGMIQKKLAEMAAFEYAMESTTFLVAAALDRGEEDIMLETAMLKVFNSECLWTIVYETMQVLGGKAFFCDEPYERMMRDARLNMIGEGANEVLRIFIGLTGMRDIGKGLEALQGRLREPIKHWREIVGFARQTLRRCLMTEAFPGDIPETRHERRKLGVYLKRLHKHIHLSLARYREGIVNEQLAVDRIASVGIYIYTCAAVLSRIERDRSRGMEHFSRELVRARHFCRIAFRAMDDKLLCLASPDERAVGSVCESLYASAPRRSHVG